MSKSREQITCNGKAVFYASIYDDLKSKAMDCGWALGLHGSLANDMDIMAMPWTEDAKPVDDMIKALSNCFEDNPFKETHTIPHYDKPNNRVVYTMDIWEDFYLDINIIQPIAFNLDKVVEELEELFKYNSEQAEVYMDGDDSYMREKKEMYMDRANCYGVAIRTVKEVGGMND